MSDLLENSTGLAGVGFASPVPGPVEPRFEPHGVVEVARHRGVRRPADRLKATAE